MSYIAVRDGIQNAIYACKKDEDLATWMCDDRNVFTDIEAVIEFDCDEKLKIGRELSVVSLEIYHGGRMSSYETSHFDNSDDVAQWLSDKIFKMSNVKIDKFSTGEYWKLQLNSNGFAFHVACIVAKVSHDPRLSEGQVKFESNGVIYAIGIDTAASQFDVFFDNHIMPKLEELANAKSLKLMHVHHVKKIVLPSMVKLLLRYNPLGSFEPTSFLKYNSSDYLYVLESILEDVTL